MRVVSLFSGAGGLDWGFVQEGHRIVWANDNDEDAVETYRKNIGAHIVFDDIENIPSGDIPECDIVIGGFPCQGFSVANTTRHAQDSRNKLYLELLRVIRDKKPKFFLVENVKGILSLEKGKIFQIILQDFENVGYRVKHTVLNAADFGVPQQRKRVIVLGVRNDLEFNIDFPCSTHSNPENFLGEFSLPWISIGEALKDIPEPKDAPNLSNHTCSKYKLRFNGYLGHRRIDPNRPAPTVTARGDNRGGVVVLHHPKNHRRMSARELATAQSFSMDYEFAGTQSSAYRQIGNAAPPLLSKALASMFPKKLRVRVKST